MPNELNYLVSGHWAAGVRSSVQTEGVDKVLEFSAPPEFHGEAGFWTPEHFLLAAVTSCFIATFRSIAGYSRFHPVSIDVLAEGTLGKGEAGYEFTRVTIKPQLTIHAEAERQLATRLLEKAKHSCLIARSLKCPVTMEASVVILPPADAPIEETAPAQLTAA